MRDFRNLDRLLQRFVDDGLPGCSCMVVRKGEVLYENYFGYADRENNIPLTERNVFRQASLTKVAMYTVAMMLYEQGKFRMTDPISDYFPEWKESRKRVVLPNGSVEIVPTEHPITVKNIMNMSCGLPYQAFDGQTGAHPVSIEMRNAMEPLIQKGNGYFTLRDQIRAMAQVPLAFEPGTRFLYGFSSELTAGLIEAVTGKTAELALKEMLFEPLGMDSSANFLFGDLEQRLVVNYHLAPGKKLGEEGAVVRGKPDRDAAMVGPLGTVPGFARVITNCRDYSALMQMLANGGVHNGERLIGRKTIDLIRTNTLTDRMIREDYSDNYLCGYGYGYGMRMLLDKGAAHCNGTVGQFGWTGGMGTWAEADPKEGLSVVYMHNLQPNLEEYHHLRMRACVYGCLE